MKTLTIKGFKTQEQVKAFASWYDGQGEQDIPIWLEGLDLGVEYMNVKSGSMKTTDEGMEMTIEPR